LESTPKNITKEDFKLIEGQWLPEGWFSYEEACLLFALGRTLPTVSPVIVEIGSWMGRSSVVLAKSISDRWNPTVYCVDPWNAQGPEQYGRELQKQGVQASDLFATFWSNMERAGVQDIVQPCPGTSEYWSTILSHQQIDMLFIDGDHSYEAVRDDILNWTPMLKEGGVLALHDFFYPNQVMTPGFESGPYNAACELLTHTAWRDGLIRGSLLTVIKGAQP
jgi:predicted O-methyltransferase YrrM